MANDVLQKYKANGNGEYTLVYESEGMDDPFGDYPIVTPTQLSNEIEIPLTGEITTINNMEDQLGEILDSYGGQENVSIAAYINQTQLYGTSSPDVDEEDEEEEDKEKEKLDKYPT